MFAIPGGDRADAHPRRSLPVRPQLALVPAPPTSAAAGGALEIRTLGRFAVVKDGQRIPAAAWRSRMARDLLKLLAACRGRPLTREQAVAALWPGEGAGTRADRLPAALCALREVLDPQRLHPGDQYIAVGHRSLALRIDRVALDLLDFLQAAGDGEALAFGGDQSGAEERLRAAEALYTGDFLEENLNEEWAVEPRQEARAAALEVSQLLARAAAARGDHEAAARHLGRLLQGDSYDDHAWVALIGAQLRLRHYGEARRLARCGQVQPTGA